MSSWKRNTYISLYTCYGFALGRDHRHMKLYLDWERHNKRKENIVLIKRERKLFLQPSKLNDMRYLYCVSSSHICGQKRTSASIKRHAYTQNIFFINNTSLIIVFLLLIKIYFWKCFFLIQVILNSEFYDIISIKIIIHL